MHLSLLLISSSMHATSVDRMLWQETFSSGRAAFQSQHTYAVLTMHSPFHLLLGEPGRGSGDLPYRSNSNYNLVLNNSFYVYTEYF